MFFYRLYFMLSFQHNKNNIVTYKLLIICSLLIFFISGYVTSLISKLMGWGHQLKMIFIHFLFFVFRQLKTLKVFLLQNNKNVIYLRLGIVLH